MTYELDSQGIGKSEDSQVSLCRICLSEFALRRNQAEQEREVEAVTESLDKTTLEDRQIEIPIETTSLEDSLMKEVLTETKHSEPDNLLPTPPKTPPLYEDPSDEDDGEGEWITPNNVALHKSKVLQLIPTQAGVRKKVITGCITTDFAMQNVLMHMGLSLVGVDGKKIDKVKTWVLRCHACFK